MYPSAYVTFSSYASWIYRLFLAIDGNFRLKRRKVSSDKRDPGLGHGWAFFVEEKAFKKHLTANWDHKQDVRRVYLVQRHIYLTSCGDSEAHVWLTTRWIGPIRKPEVLRPPVLLESSAPATSLNCPMALGIFRRERGTQVPSRSISLYSPAFRYINVDYVVFSALVSMGEVQDLVLSYDIICQWYKNLQERMHLLPDEIVPIHDIQELVFLIPKFHLPAHIDFCNRTYSFNLSRWVGRSDGEAPERGWARINNVAKSTAEMGPGTRRDTIDDHFNDGNWKKTSSLGGFPNLSSLFCRIDAHVGCR